MTKKQTTKPNDCGICVYILRCKDGTLYAGWTNDIEKRIKAHNAGTASKYTRGRTPVELVYSENLPTREQALSREAQIKKLKKSEKLALIKASENGRP